MNKTHLHVHAWRSNLLDVTLVLHERLRGSHRRNEAHGHLGDGLGGNDRLGASSSETAGHAVYIERRASPGSLEHAVAVFANELAGSDLVDAVVLFIERQTAPG